MRATAENPADRFVSLADFRDALLSEDFESSLNYKKSERAPLKKSKLKIFIPLLVGVLIVASFTAKMLAPSPAVESGIAESTYKEISRSGYRNPTEGVYIKPYKEWKADRENVYKLLSDDYKEDFRIAAMSYDEVKKDALRKAEKENDIMKDFEVQMALSRAKRARESLANLKETLISLEQELADDSAYRKYVSYEYKRMEKLKPE